MFKIKHKIIAEGNPTFIIAEGGINHNGEIKIAKKIVEKAAEIGADAIKFQTFTASDLTSIESKYYKLFKKLEFNESQFGEISDYAKQKDIIFLATPFSEKAVDVLTKLQVPAFKIASGDLTHIPLIKYASSKNKPMIISTGMANMQEINDAVKTIKSQNNSRIAILHSVSSYPTPFNEANLNSIKTLKKNFRFPVGYSDNGSNNIVPLIAVAMGAKIIEKHFTLNKKSIGPDHKLSANILEFKKMVKNIHEIEEMLGDGKKKPQPSEKENLIHIRRGITANVIIEKNTKIKQDMITIKRPAKGIHPKHFKFILGKTSKKTIKKDSPIYWNDIK